MRNIEITLLGKVFFEGDDDFLKKTILNNIENDITYKKEEIEGCDEDEEKFKKEYESELYFLIEEEKKLKENIKFMSMEEMAEILMDQKCIRKNYKFSIIDDDFEEQE